MTAPSAPVKAFLKTEQGVQIDCLFNPSELTITKSATWQASAAWSGVEMPTPDSTGRSVRALSRPAIPRVVPASAERSPVTPSSETL